MGRKISLVNEEHLYFLNSCGKGLQGPDESDKSLTIPKNLLRLSIRNNLEGQNNLKNKNNHKMTIFSIFDNIFSEGL